MENILRTYSKTQLASLYLPHIKPASARRTFTRWIEKNKDMKQELVDAGYTKTVMLLTPRQVRIIFKYLGAP